MATAASTSVSIPNFPASQKTGKADDVTESVTSLKVTNFGGCSSQWSLLSSLPVSEALNAWIGADMRICTAYYYTGSGCQGSPQHVDTLNSCDGYAQGDRIGSFNVNC